MEKKAVSGIMLRLLVASMFTLAFNIQPVKAEPRNWTVDDDGPADFHTIQEAINAASEGDTIFVRTGIYNEGWREIEIPVFGPARIVVNKNVTIRGEDRDSTILNGAGVEYAIAIMVNGVSITGFTIENAGLIAGGGILVYYYRQQVTISRNRIRNNINGIILTGDSKHNSIVENKIVDSLYDGIILARSSYNLVKNNMIVNNSAGGIYMGVDWDAHHNVIVGNDIVNSTFGIAMEESSMNTFYHNNFINVWTMQVSGQNIWDDDYPSGGNYWSNYADVDLYSGLNQDIVGSDGIWDHVYTIDSNNRDRYPLIEPWSTPAMIKVLIRTVRFWNLPKGTENSLTSKLEEGLNLLGIGNENGAVHKLMGFVSQVEALREKKLTDEQANYLKGEAQRIIELINE